MTSQDELEEIFLVNNPSNLVAKVRRTMEDNYASQLSSELDTTYSHTIKMLQRLEDKNILERNKDGRKSMIELTEKGKDIADSIIEVKESCSEKGNLEN